MRAAPTRRSRALTTRAKRIPYAEYSPPATHRALATRTTIGWSARCAASVLESRSSWLTVASSPRWP
ncbi:hypothetical protein AF335_24545 [Streptomyces eurocidicus]|uniref:Uncharacterized protein n=1 Tax=Streptomyces eurocidicus TaxID=66423 RepID=A0A2N8NR27_STREU|nr:hypothetical protein AF335_24545 [Streptomyces eurocidicus]